MTLFVFSSWSSQLAECDLGVTPVFFFRHVVSRDDRARVRGARGCAEADLKADFCSTAQNDRFAAR